ncbi:hypothetical protein R5H32_18005 [Defluviimonas sp. D31]|uniref:hypothetical protein n=1 Tax=Defluviimonas sp. D31 TaxID=3083253 RepID=UPI00296EAF90|nr:hypothetical protein [Defluviimonas sp. D31]MDW4551255.1 hypothetical protein [Defluviimonas sp. D31]
MVLIVRLLATIAAVNLFTLAVFVGLATLQYNSILSGLIRERLVVLGETVRVPFQAVADLGVSIGTVRNADAVLERARMSDESIGFIHVISPSGEIVRSTSQAPETRVEASILEASRAAATGATWIKETHDSFLAGTNIVGATGSDAGIILIEYSKRDANVQIEAMEARLLLLAGSVLGATILTSLIILRIALSEHLRIFDGILSTFDGFERKFWRGDHSEGEAATAVSGLGINTSDFVALLESSENRYQQAKKTPPINAKTVDET